MFERWGRRLLAISLSLFTFAASAATVDSVRVWRAPDHTRLVFDLSGPVEHKLFTLESPNRLVIDVEDSSLKGSFADLDLSKTPIDQFRSAQRNKNDLRVVLDLSTKVKPRSFVLKKQAGINDRLVVDLFDESETVKTVKSVMSESKGQKRDIIVAIDAGHGGEDPGAIGPKKVREKDVVFSISKELARLINAEPGYKAVLVRTGDYYIPLHKRRDIARENRADLFVSIHADAFTNPKARGASVFALSRRGATSETASFLAKRENDADLIGGVGSVSLGDKDKVLAGVLVDLSMTATLSSSLQVGHKVLTEMDKVAHLHKNQVEQAGFAVLKSPDVPSILVETGFISNPGEAKKLSSQSYRNKLSKQIFSGVKKYFYQFPPAGSYVAWKKNGGRDNAQVASTRVHVIGRGDTLSGLAARYRVSVEKLKSHNGMNGNNIRIGQELKIPTS